MSIFGTGKAYLGSTLLYDSDAAEALSEAQFHMSVATNNAAPAGFSDGFADNFDNTTGIDSANSSNYDTGTAKQVSPAAGSAVTVSYTDETATDSGLTTYTFSSQSIGAADSSRIVVVGAGGRSTSSGRTITSVTIGGDTATEIVQTNNGSGVTAGFFMLAVPSGTTADIVVTYSGGMIRTDVGVWAVYNASTTVSDYDSSTATNPTTSSLSVPGGGAAIGYASLLGSADGRSTTWTGLTEDFDQTWGGNWEVNSGAHDTFSSASNPTITATPTASCITQCGVFVAFGPASAGALDMDLRLVGENLGPTQATISAETYADSTADGTNYTGTFNLGAYAADRKMVIGVASYSNTASAPRGVSSLTLDSHAASGLAGTAQDDGDRNAVEMLIIDTGAGSPFEGNTTASFSLTFDGTCLRAAVYSFATYGANSTTLDTGGASAASNPSDTLSVAASGVAAGIVLTGSGSHAWSGLTETSEHTLESASEISGGIADIKATDSALTITCTTAAAGVMTLASFKSADDDGSIATLSLADGFLIIKDTVGITLNTDIKVYLSGDGGGSWVQGTLEQVFNSGDYYLLQATNVDISAHNGYTLAMRITNGSGTGATFDVLEVAAKGQ